jgi:hypothetical protein
MKKFDEFDKPTPQQQQLINEQMHPNYSAYQPYTQPAPGSSPPLHFFQNSANSAMITQQSVQNVYTSFHREDNISPFYYADPRTPQVRPQVSSPSISQNSYNKQGNNQWTVLDTMTQDQAPQPQVDGIIPGRQSWYEQFVSTHNGEGANFQPYNNELSPEKVPTSNTDPLAFPILLAPEDGGKGGPMTPIQKQKELLKYYERVEEEKRTELGAIQSKIRYLKEQIDRNQSYLDDRFLVNKHIRKLHALTYEALFNNFVENEEVRKRYLRNGHPQVKNITDLAGVIYFINVDKTTKKPPKVGHPFRCYSESHYSSVNREQPIICKVKEWPCDDVKCWRLYHYYLGKTGRPRKRNPNGTEGSFSSEEDPSPNVSGEDYDRKRGPEEDGEFDQRSTKRFKSEYEQR